MDEQRVLDSVDRRVATLVYREMDRVYPRVLPNDHDDEVLDDETSAVEA